MDSSAVKPKARYPYDVCLSFAGEDRAFVKKVALGLQAAGVRVFFDDFEDLWGADLYEHLDRVYSKLSRYCVMFCSDNYAKKLWTNHERKSAQARAFEENSQYILPARFDETEIPGIRKTIGYLDLRTTTPKDLTAKIIAKVRASALIDLQGAYAYMPESQDVLLKRLKATSSRSRQAATLLCWRLFRSLSLLTEAERRPIACVFECGCPHDIPNNMHMSIDLLGRMLKSDEASLRRDLSKVGSVGFHVRFPSRGKNRRYENIYIEWHFWSDGIAKLVDQGHTNFTGFAKTMLDTATEPYCSDHSIQSLTNLNFAPLSSEYYLVDRDDACKHDDLTE
jgi:TIR domain